MKSPFHIMLIPTLGCPAHCKLLALKAGDSDVGSKALIYEIYKYLEDMKNELTNEEKLLAEQWVQAYKKVPEKTVEKRLCPLLRSG